MIILLGVSQSYSLIDKGSVVNSLEIADTDTEEETSIPVDEDTLKALMGFISGGERGEPTDTSWEGEVEAEGTSVPDEDASGPKAF